MEPLKQHMLFDHSPMADLYKHYAPTILIYIRRHVPTREDAEDMLLDVFVAALEHERMWALSEQEQLLWLRRVAHNKFVDYHRRAKRRSVVPLGESDEELFDPEELVPEQIALRRETHARLRLHLATLPELQREVLRLRFANGLRCTEIANILNKSEGAVRTLLSRSLNLLRGIYKKYGEEMQND